jgi:hypothetical protein
LKSCREAATEASEGAVAKDGLLAGDAKVSGVADDTKLSGPDDDASTPLSSSAGSAAAGELPAETNRSSDETSRHLPEIIDGKDFTNSYHPSSRARKQRSRQEQILAASSPYANQVIKFISKPTKTFLTDSPLA